MRPAEQAILDARPALSPYALEAVQLVLQAYADLGTCRPIGMDVGKIPITAIWAWVDRRDSLDGEGSQVVVDAIRYVDDADFAERMKKRKSAQPGPGKPPRGPIARAAQEASR